MGPCEWLPIAYTMGVQALNPGDRVAAEDKDRRFTFLQNNY